MFFKKKDKNEFDDTIKITALLIHAAKIDEDYTLNEKEIIKKAITEIDKNIKNIDDIINKAEEIEKNSNQILDFTKEVKNIDKSKKIKIIEILWKIIYSDKKADVYESNLMRRLAGLLYIDSKTMGDIKLRIKEKNL
tara:strand:- start:107 stop:517 length:411 start_codon:yes stop_codon:yes gene_type:complete